MSTRGTLAQAIVDRLSALIGGTLPSETRVFLMVAPEQIMSMAQQPALGISVVLQKDDAAHSRELTAVRQTETWTWLIYAVAAPTVDPATGAERAWVALEAIRASICPGAGWRIDSYCQHTNYGGSEYMGYTGNESLVLRSTYTTDRYTGT